MIGQTYSLLISIQICIVVLGFRVVGSFQLIAFSGLDRFSSSQCSLAFFRGFCPGILHSFCPCHGFWAITHFNNRFVRDQIQVQHFVAVGTQYHEISDFVVVSVPVNVGNFEYGWNPESTVRTKLVVMSKGEFSVVYSFRHTLVSECERFASPGRDGGANHLPRRNRGSGARGGSDSGQPLNQEQTTRRNPILNRTPGGAPSLLLPSQI